MGEIEPNDLAKLLRALLTNQVIELNKKLEDEKYQRAMAIMNQSSSPTPTPDEIWDWRIVIRIYFWINSKLFRQNLDSI